ncbi:MAG: hypothetical protein QNJ55_04145 [Xenococcus sp. MO_188.B8]|nr:hypothetical protein [Xenococcus sp. MO_188.B8]
MFFSRHVQQINWSAIIMFALGFWLSSSLVFDCLVIPGLLSSGMMSQDGFASAGYTIFGTFNHVELICAAIILAGSLVWNYSSSLGQLKIDRSIWFAGMLLAIAIIYTYILTPQMSAWGMSLTSSESMERITMPMKTMHIAYWSLEATKLILATSLLSKFYRSSCRLV